MSKRVVDYTLDTAENVTLWENGVLLVDGLNWQAAMTVAEWVELAKLAGKGCHPLDARPVPLELD